MSVEKVGEARPGKAGVVSQVIASQKRQAGKFVADLVRMRGLMPLLMKNRNGDKWSDEEKSELLSQLRALSRASPYLLFLLLPGSALLLPVYAWWLDRRRKPRADRTDRGGTKSNDAAAG